MGRGARVGSALVGFLALLAVACSDSDGSSASSTLAPSAPSSMSPTTPVEPNLGEVWAPAQEGWGTPHPQRIFNGGDPTGIAFDLAWESWGGPTATAHGQTYLVPEGEGYGVADAVPGPVTVVAFDLGDCHGYLAYRQYQWLTGDQQLDAARGSDYDICPAESFSPE